MSHIQKEMLELLYITIMNKLYEIKNGKLIYLGYDLTKYAEKYHTPLKICFLDVITKRVNELKEAFKIAKENLNYKRAFVYLNANKANYGYKEIETAFQSADGLETSSCYDLKLTKSIMKDSKKYLVCNGYKLQDYVDEIIDAYKSNMNIIDVIDSVSEYEMLKKANLPLNVGLRIHIESQYSLGENDRFGLNDDEFNYILNDLKNTKLQLKMIHYHQRGFDYEEAPFKTNFVKVFEKYYVRAAKKYSTVDSFNMGGGTPLPIDGDFDYPKWATFVLSMLKEIAEKNGLVEPYLFSENGKYSQKDATVTIYKVVGKKNTNKYPWLIVDGSLLIAMPEHYALGEPIEVLPINDLDKKMNKFCLAGITCDCDDVLFDHHLGYVELPESDNLYIGLLGTGSYQNSMNGKGGVHHCLLPEEKDLVIYNKDGKEIVEVRKELQTIDDIMKII